MSRTLNIVAVLVAAFAAGVLALTGPQPPTPVEAADCDPENTGTLIIHIVDISSNDDLDVSGASVIVEPDPEDFRVDTVLHDTANTDASATLDSDPAPGVIRYEGACSTGSGESYEATLYDLPSFLEEDCEVTSGEDSSPLAAGETAVLTIEVDCTDLTAGATATAEASATAGPASTLNVIISTLSLGCSGTTVVTVQIRDASGQSVGPGVPVSFSTNLGTVSPSSGILTGDTGDAFAFYSAPASGSGTATITAISGTLSGSGVIAVNCGDAAVTVAPPPTGGTGSVGVITPPNTGSAGLAAE